MPRQDRTFNDELVEEDNGTNSCLTKEDIFNKIEEYLDDRNNLSLHVEDDPVKSKPNENSSEAESASQASHFTIEDVIDLEPSQSELVGPEIVANVDIYNDNEKEYPPKLESSPTVDDSATNKEYAQKRKESLDEEKLTERCKYVKLYDEKQ